MGVIAASVNVPLDNVETGQDKLYRMKNDSRMLPKQRSQVVLSPINLKESLDSKELTNMRQKQHMLGRDSSKVASIQLRSLRNLP